MMELGKSSAMRTNMSLLFFLRCYKGTDQDKRKRHQYLFAMTQNANFFPYTVLVVVRGNFQEGFIHKRNRIHELLKWIVKNLERFRYYGLCQRWAFLSLLIPGFPCFWTRLCFETMVFLRSFWLNVVDSKDALYMELWHACAGPLVIVPREGERVFYFPQGHIEQVLLLFLILWTGFLFLSLSPFVVCLCFLLDYVFCC